MILLNYPFFIIAFLTGMTYVIAGFVMQKKPPKKINNLYGYRTKRSMKSQEHWDFAQKFSAKAMIQWGSLLCLIACLNFVFPMNEIAASIGAVVLTIVFALIPLYYTEKEMKERFD